METQCRWQRWGIGLDEAELCCHFKLYVLSQFLQREVDALREEISVMRKTAAERKEQLQKEFETHTQIKKDIEVYISRATHYLYQFFSCINVQFTFLKPNFVQIQNRRCEAIVKRLHCQLSRAQAQHRYKQKQIQPLRGHPRTKKCSRSVNVPVLDLNLNSVAAAGRCLRRSTTWRGSLQS